MPGLLFYTVGLTLFAFATQGWMMFVFLIPYCLGGIAGPSLQSTMAQHVPKNEQGELQGALTSLMSLTTIIGPLIMNNLFKYFTTDKAPFYFPGVSFLLGAFFMLLSLFIAWKVLSREKKNKSRPCYLTTFFRASIVFFSLPINILSLIMTTGLFKKVYSSRMN